MAESTQKKLDRVRPPRVQITYDVETGGALEKRELPFLVGVMADLSGMPAEPLPKMKERKFVEIDRDNFNTVLSAAKPRVAFQVTNTLAKDDSKLNVLLEFNDMDEFEPLGLIRKIAPLSKLYDARQRLTDLLAKLDGNDELDGLLNDVIANTDQQAELKSETKGSADVEAEA
jgi:type VI secretion system protein ImpB